MDDLSEATSSNTPVVGDIEDLAGAKNRPVQSVINVSKRKRTETSDVNSATVLDWREALGRPPPMGNSQVN